MPKSEVGNCPLHPSPLPTALNLLLRDTMSSFWSPLSLPLDFLFYTDYRRLVRTFSNIFQMPQHTFCHYASLVVDFALISHFLYKKRFSNILKITIWVWGYDVGRKEFGMWTSCVRSP